MPRLKLQNDLRTTALQAIAGLAVLAGAVLAFQQLTADRQQATATQELTRQGQASERFTRASTSSAATGPRSGWAASMGWSRSPGRHPTTAWPRPRCWSPTCTAPAHDQPTPHQPAIRASHGAAARRAHPRCRPR